MYARHWLLGPAPRHALLEEGMPPSTAYHFIQDELIVDGSSRFNLATFWGTWMEPEANRLMTETFDDDRQGRIPSDGRDRDAVRSHAGRAVACSGCPQCAGTFTVGSSEACMLGGLALQWRWLRERRKGKPAGYKRPGVLAQVCPILGC
jgi:glutamate decarboxylase